MTGERGADHGVAGADLPCHQYQQQRIGAARTTDRVTGAAKGGELGLENVHFWALDKLAMSRHPCDGLIDRRTETPTLCRHINEGYRPLFDPCVLIHVRARAFSLEADTTINRRPGGAPAVARPWRALHGLRGNESRFQGWPRLPPRSPRAFLRYESHLRKRRAPNARAPRSQRTDAA